MTTTFSEIFISCDIEATGKNPGDYSMSSIGAYVAGGRTSEGEIVHFTKHPDSAQAEINPDNVFYAELKPLPGSSFSVDAIKVGLLKGMTPEEAATDTTGEARWAHMHEHGEDPKQAMEKFAQFVDEAEKRYTIDGKKPLATFTAYPASFDWMFVYWYFCHFDINSPFGFSRVLDLKAVFAMKSAGTILRASKRFMPKSVFAKLPHTHSADDDAIEQGIMGINLMNLPSN